MPGFTAESSLGPATPVYGGTAFLRRSCAVVSSAAWPVACLHLSPARFANNTGRAGHAVSSSAQAFPGNVAYAQRSCTTTYYGYLVFPMTVCDPPVVLEGRVLSQRIASSPIAPDSQRIPHVNGAAPQGAAFWGANACFAWEGRALNTPDRAVRRRCCASDPWRATPSVRTLEPRFRKRQR
jgi:hypothetical protein